MCAHISKEMTAAATEAFFRGWEMHIFAGGKGGSHWCQWQWKWNVGLSETRSDVGICFPVVGAAVRDDLQLFSFIKWLQDAKEYFLLQIMGLSVSLIVLWRRSLLCLCGSLQRAPIRLITSQPRVCWTAVIKQCSSSKHTRDYDADCVYLYIYGSLIQCTVSHSTDSCPLWLQMKH